jgi:hypothetical protein
MEFRIESDFEVDLKRIDEGHQPSQQLLVDGMVVVGFEEGAVGELHHACELVSLRAGRDVVADEGFDEAGDLTLKSLDLPDNVLFLLLSNTGFPAKREGMNDHEASVMGVRLEWGERILETQGGPYVEDTVDDGGVGNGGSAV